MLSDFHKALDEKVDKKSLILRSLAVAKETQERGIRSVRRSGTTILALHYKDSVLMAGDRRMTEWDIHTDDAIKIGETQNNTLIGCAGTVSFIQDIKETLLHQLTWLEDIIEKPIYVDGQAMVLKNILKTNFDYYGAWTYVLGYAVPILAGFHPEEEEGFIFEFDEAGGTYEKKDYATTGSGGRLAWGVLKDRWEVDLKEEDAVDLAVRALTLASFDNYSSNPLISPSTIAVVSKDKGIRFLEEEKALGMAYSIFREYLKRHGRTKELNFFIAGEEV